MSERLRWSLQEAERRLQEPGLPEIERAVLQGEIKDLKRSIKAATQAEKVRGSVDEVIRKLSELPSVELAEGTYKFAMVEVQPRGRSEVFRFVRSKSYADYHYMAIQELREELELKIGCYRDEISIPGGGRCTRDSIARTVHVYGYSNQYGQAPMALVKEVIEASPEYAGYTVSYSLDGY